MVARVIDLLYLFQHSIDAAYIAEFHLAIASLYSPRGGSARRLLWEWHTAQTRRPQPRRPRTRSSAASCQWLQLYRRCEGAWKKRRWRRRRQLRLLWARVWRERRRTG